MGGAIAVIQKYGLFGSVNFKQQAKDTELDVTDYGELLLQEVFALEWEPAFHHHCKVQVGVTILAKPDEVGYIQILQEYKWPICARLLLIILYTSHDLFTNI